MRNHEHRDWPAKGSRETFQTDDAEKIKMCCEAMRDGRDVQVVVSGIALRGRPVTIRCLDDGNFQITLRQAA